MKKLILTFLIIISLLLVAAVGYRLLRVPIRQDTTKINVTATFYPLAEFTKAVGADWITVETLIPPGSEPHDFDLTPKEIVHLDQSSLFIYNGAGFESWIEKVIPQIETNKIKIVNMSSKVDLILEDDTMPDPHFWLDPQSAIKEVAAIQQALDEIDPTHAEYYSRNADSYINRLEQLDRTISEQLGRCTKRDIIVSHDAFGYYARRYNLNVVSIAGLSPEEEPSAQRLAEISQFAKNNAVKYIFFESLVSPRLSDTIAKEVGAQTLVFNPIEGLTQAQVNRGENYFSVQEENLRNLKIALECEL
ncbi:MAG: zinc ABC transporter substrate-binding protein [bacterium]|nr:zinc ABC transporter substrate-binding protein [bacterium]